MLQLVTLPQLEDPVHGVHVQQAAHQVEGKRLYWARTVYFKILSLAPKTKQDSLRRKMMVGRTAVVWGLGQRFYCTTLK